MNKNAINDIQLRIENGTLVDKDGFSYERVKRGIITNYTRFSSIEVEQKSNGMCILKAIFNENTKEDIATHSITTPTTHDLPMTFDTIQSISFTDLTGKGELLPLVIEDIGTDITSISIKYRNMTNGIANTSDYKASITIIGTKLGNIPNLN